MGRKKLQIFIEYLRIAARYGILLGCRHSSISSFGKMITEKNIPLTAIYYVEYLEAKKTRALALWHLLHIMDSST
jgi:hypothetical protein